MIPILFKENETNFNSNGIGHLRETITYDVREVRNGEFELYLEYPITGKWFKEIKDFRLILAEPNETDEDHLFRIYETVKDVETQTIFIYATTRSNDLGGNLVDRVIIENETAQQAMTKIKQNLIMPSDYNFVSDIQTRSSTEWVRRNPLNCIAGEEGSLVNYWGGEIKRTNDTIYLYSRRGKDRVTTIRSGKNLGGFKLTASTKGMITRILPFFSYTPSGRDTPITITGSVVDSPLVNNYPVKYITPVDFSSDQTITTLAQLNTAAKTYFSNMNPGCDKPSVTIDVDLIQLSDSSEYERFKALERINLTDTVTVWVPAFDVDVEVKVNEVTYNGMLQQVTNIIAGSVATNLYDDVKKDYKNDVNELQKYVEGMENGIHNTIEFATDGLAKIFRGYTEPAVDISKLNDLWYKEIGNGEVELWIFDGAYWQPLLTAGISAETRAAVDAALAKGESDKLQALAAIEQANIDAKAYTDQKGIEFDTKFAGMQLDVGAINSKVDAAETKVAEALTKADTAISNAGFAQVDATKAKQDAATAIGNASTAVTNASNALTNANSALSKATALETTTGTLTTNYDSLTQTVGLKADKTVVDTLTQTVTTQGTSIDLNTSAIALRATTQTVNALTQVVNTQGAELKLTSEGLAFKAEKSVVDTMGGTVSTHSTQITAANAAIALRLTSTQVESAITAKNYVNTTQLAATSAGLNLSITAVSNDLANLEVGGRNYFTKSTSIVATVATGSFTPRAPETPNGFKMTGAQNGAGNIRINNVITENGWWTVSFDIKGTQSTNVGLYVDICDLGQTRVVSNDLNTYTRVSVSVNVTNFSTVYNFIDFSGIGLAYYLIDKIKVEKGNKAGDWSPAPEDMATLEQYTTLDATVAGLQVTVGDKASTAQLTVLSNQIATKVASTDYNSKMTQLDSLISARVTSATYDAKMTLLDSAINLRVTSATYNSKMTLLDNAINLRVVQSDVTAAILADKKVKDTRSTNQLPSWYYSNYSAQIAEEFKTRTVIGVPGSATYGLLTTKVAYPDASGGAITQIFSSSDGVYQRVSTSTSAWGAWDKVAEAGQLLSQINLSTEGVLIAGKRIQLDGDVTMTTAFVNDLNTKTLSAVTANIASIRSQVLVTNSVTATHVLGDVAMINNLFATTALIDTLTSKSAFIATIKSIDIAADRITAGTLNAAVVNIINLNASKIATGTLTGANYSLDLVTGIETFVNASNGDTLTLNQAQIKFKNGSQERHLIYNAEGLQLKAGVNNAGTSKNTSLWLIGEGSGSYAYIQFVENNTASTDQRIEAEGGNIRVLTAPGGKLEVRTNGTRALNSVLASRYVATGVSGATMTVTPGSLETERTGNRSLQLMPTGTGKVEVTDGTYWWNVKAKAFETVSTRTIKANITPYLNSGLDVIRNLNVVEYNMRQDLEQGIYDRKIGLISEDSPMVASAGGLSVDLYTVTMFNTKAIQDLDLTILTEVDLLKQKIKSLELRVYELEMAA